MSFSAGSITGSLGFDISGFTSSMLEVEGLTSLFPGWVTAGMANPLLGLAVLAKDVAGAIVDAFSEVLSITAQVGAKWDDLGESAEKVGVSARFLSSIGAAAADAGSSVEGLADALKFLNNNAADAADGGEVAKSFAAIGVSATDLAGKVKPVESLFLEVADAIAATEDRSKRVQAAMNLLGRGGVDMLAFLGQGSAGIQDAAGNITEFGGVVDDTMARVGDRFGTLSAIVGNAMGGLSDQLALPVLEWLEAHMDEILSLIREIYPEARNLASALGGAVADGLTVVLNVAQSLLPVLEALLNALAFVARGVSTAFEGVSGALGFIGIGGPTAPSQVAPSSVAPPSGGVAIGTLSVAVDADSSAAAIAQRLAPAVREAAGRHQAEMSSAAIADRIRRGL